MKLYHYQAESPNFGDELNQWLWPRVFPRLLNEDDRQWFVGIGTVIGEVAALTGKKIIFGAGFSEGYHRRPQIKSDDWKFYFVRGPRTADQLGLSGAFAICDPAILVRECLDYKQRTPQHIAFMPHWQSMATGQWKKVCQKAGVVLIDPRRPVEEVLDLILRSRLVITEAMHGAIVADALRVPWVPMMPMNPIHRDKWYDWAESLGIKLKFRQLVPSSLRECTLETLGFVGCDRVSADVQETKPNRASVVSRIKSLLLKTPVALILNWVLMRLAARRLKALSQLEGSLSDEAQLIQAVVRIKSKIYQLQQDYGQVLKSA